MSEAFCESTNLLEFEVRVASISNSCDDVGWLVRSELFILVESHVTIFFNAEINKMYTLYYKHYSIILHLLWIIQCITSNCLSCQGREFLFWSQICNEELQEWPNPTPKTENRVEKYTRKIDLSLPLFDSNICMNLRLLFWRISNQQKWIREHRYQTFLVFPP